MGEEVMGKAVYKTRLDMDRESRRREDERRKKLKKTQKNSRKKNR
jgi:hypothetical protein